MSPSKECWALTQPAQGGAPSLEVIWNCGTEGQWHSWGWTWGSFPTFMLLWVQLLQNSLLPHYNKQLLSRTGTAVPNILLTMNVNCIPQHSKPCKDSHKPSPLAQLGLHYSKKWRAALGELSPRGKVGTVGKAERWCERPQTALEPTKPSRNAKKLVMFCMVQPVHSPCSTKQKPMLCKTPVGLWGNCQLPCISPLLGRRISIGKQIKKWKRQEQLLFLKNKGGKKRSSWISYCLLCSLLKYMAKKAKGDRKMLWLHLLYEINHSLSSR